MSATVSTSAPVISAMERPVFRRHVVTHPETEKPFNAMLADVHRSLIPKKGIVFHDYPNHTRFPTDAGAKTLAKKWSKSFHDKRPDFKEAGLWVRFYIDTMKKSIKVTVEAFRPELVETKEHSEHLVPQVPFCPPLPPCPPPVPYGYPMSYGYPVPYGFPMRVGAPMHFVAPMPFGYPYPNQFPVPYGIPELSQEEVEETDV
jgi:hypothetical protein